MIALDLSGSLLLSAITAAFILISAIVAIHGLFNDYKTDEGKLNRKGYVISALIVLLGCCTLASSVIQENASKKKEREDYKIRSMQFDAQMAALTSVTNSLSKLQESTLSSVRAQNDIYLAQQSLLHRADQNLRLSEAGRLQAGKDSERLLRRLFDESNRVDFERITVGTSIDCPPYPDGVGRRLAVKTATLHVIPFADTTAQRQMKNLRPQLAKSLSLRPGPPGEFRGHDGQLGPLQYLRAWRDTKIAIDLTVGDPGLMTLEEATALWRQARDETLRPNCKVTAWVTVNNRRIAGTNGVITEISKGEYAVDIPIADVDNSVLPEITDYDMAVANAEQTN